MGPGQVGLGEGGIGAVADEPEAALGEGFGPFAHRGGGACDVGRTALGVEAEVDRQSDQLADEG